MLQSVAAAGPAPAAREFPQTAVISIVCDSIYRGKPAALCRIFGSSIYEASRVAVINAGLISHGRIANISSTCQGASNVPMSKSAIAVL